MLEEVYAEQQGRVGITGNVRDVLYYQLKDVLSGGAIPVDKSGELAFVTTGAETRTLAAPKCIGQQLLLYMQTDGGDCAVTCATGLNQTGNTVATFNDAGDMLQLVAIKVGSNLRWRVVANDGVTLS